MTKLWNKLIKLGKLLSEIFVSYVFLDGLNLLYNIWKNIYFLSYSKTLKNKYRKMI